MERELALMREKNYQLVNRNAQLTRENEHLRKKQNGVNQLDYVEVKIRELKEEHEKEMSSLKKQQWV